MPKVSKELGKKKASKLVTGKEAVGLMDLAKQTEARLDAKLRERSEGGGGSSTYAKVPQGLSFWQLGPRRIDTSGKTPKPQEFYREFTYFWYTDDEGQRAVLVSLESWGQPCPVLEFWRKLYKKNDPYAKKFKPQKSVYFNALRFNEDGEQETEGWVILQTRPTVLDAVTEMCVETDPNEGGKLYLPGEEYIIRIRRKGQGLKTKYTAKKYNGFPPVAITEDMMLELHDLTDIEVRPDVEELREFVANADLDALTAEPEAKDDDGGSRGKRGRKKPKDDDEDDEDDD